MDNNNNNTNKKNADSIGKSFDQLSIEDMMKLQGAGDIEGDTTPLATITTSSIPCGAAISGAASIIISKITK